MRDWTCFDADTGTHLIRPAVGGKAETAAKNDTLEFALDGLDQEAFYVQSVWQIWFARPDYFLPAHASAKAPQKVFPAIKVRVSWEQMLHCQL